jgi:hypothetical protein
VLDGDWTAKGDEQTWINARALELPGFAQLQIRSKDLSGGHTVFELVRLQLFPVPCGFRAVPTGRHVAPAAAAVLRVVEKHAAAARIGALPNTRELAEDEGVRGGFDNWNNEPGERISDWNERPYERSVNADVDAARTRTAAEYAIDFHESFGAHALAHGPTLGKRAKGRTDASSIDDGGGRAGRLLLRTASNAARAFRFEHGGGLEPANHRFKIAQRVEATNTLLAVDEVQPQSFPDEDERRPFARGARRRERRQRNGVG